MFIYYQYNNNFIAKMIANSNTLQPTLQQPLPQDRKLSLHKNNNINTYQLELPRFYSSDQKQKAKKILVNKKSLQSNHNLNFNYNQSRKKQTLLSIKTQKNDTPSKEKDLSSKKIKGIQQKWNEILQNSISGKKQVRIQGKSKQDSQRLKSKIQIITTNPTKQSQSANRIRYKKMDKRNEEVSERQSKNKKNIDKVEVLQVEREVNNNLFYRRQQLLTEQISNNLGKNINNQLINKFQQYLKEAQIDSALRSPNKLRTFSTFEPESKQSIGQLQKAYLKTICDLIKKTIKHMNNLDYPQAYIVEQKQKYQSRIFWALSYIFRKEYIIFMSYMRFTYFLCAHLILLSINTKILLPILNKLLQSQESLVYLLVNQEAKKQSLKKATSNSVIKKNTNVGEQNYNYFKVIHRNNDAIKKILQKILENENLGYRLLFLEFMESVEIIDNIQFVAYIDKTLKWEILKMPTFPFLPKPPHALKQYLILDLDETLIHFDQQAYHVRPHVQPFLSNISEYYELTIFTAATQEYADEIIDQIDKKRYIKHRLYRNHLTFLNGQSIKDLTMLGRDMKNTILVDNLQNNFRLNPENGIAIKSWFGNNEDNILIKLQTLLKKMAVQFADDLRKGIKFYRSFIDRQIAEKIHYKKNR